MNADIPEWEMLIDESGRVTFAHPRPAHAYLRRFAGQCISAQFYEQKAKRSSRQNRAAHALIAEWIAQSESLRGQTIEAVKQWLLSRAFGWHEIVDVETGEVIKVLAEPHTSKLTVSQFCAFIEAVLELAAVDGVMLLAPDEYRKAKERAALKAAREAAA